MRMLHNDRRPCWRSRPLAIAVRGTYPPVSAIIPVHNGERFLAEAVASLRVQRYAPLEIIVVDDGSTDGTPDLIARLGVAVLAARQPQQGPAAARNSGLALARGEFIAFLDADDLRPPGTLHVQVERLLREPALDVLLGRTRLVRAADLANPHTADRADPLIAMHLGCAVFRRDIFDRVGPFDERLRFSEDHDWFLRAREQRIGMAVLDTVTLLHRRHARNMTRGQASQGYGLPGVLKASLDRRRARSGGDPLPLPKLADSCEAAAPRAQEHG